MDKCKSMNISHCKDPSFQKLTAENLFFGNYSTSIPFACVFVDGFSLRSANITCQHSLIGFFGGE